MPGPCKSLLLCAASPGTSTHITLAHSLQTLFCSSQTPASLGTLLQVALPLTHSLSFFRLEPPHRHVCVQAQCLAALACWTSQVNPRPAVSPCICLTICTSRGPVPGTTPALLSLFGGKEGTAPPVLELSWLPSHIPLVSSPTLPAPQQDSR